MEGIVNCLYDNYNYSLIGTISENIRADTKKLGKSYDILQSQ